MPVTLCPEWCRQSGVLLTWPHPNGTWGTSLTTIENVFTDIAQAVSLREKLIVACLDDDHQNHVRELLTSHTISNFNCYIAPSNDIWARDHGPITVLKEQQLELLNFNFNGWGKKYPYALDNQITLTLQQQDAFQVPVTSIDFVLEGGSIETDGYNLMTTTTCLLNPNRNPNLDRTDIETVLSQQFGVNDIFWLQHGALQGDDTDSHIDNLARFVNDNTILYSSCDESDEQHPELNAMQNELIQFRNHENKPYQLILLPLPKAQYKEGQRLPLSYANFLIINEAVLLPIYDDAKDQHAEEVLQQCFPDREIIPIYARPLVEQFGSIHCASMQFPEGVL